VFNIVPAPTCKYHSLSSPRNPYNSLSSPRIPLSNLYFFYFLLLCKSLAHTLTCSTLLPHSLIDDTLATLDLVIPHTSAKCNRWLNTEVARKGLDPNISYRISASQCISDYPHWQTRLSAIAEALERSKPATVGQWWHDRRDMGQWWGFWLLVIGIFLTVLFGLIQSITGIIQVTRPAKE
jgi:hypothetical protein